MSLLTNILILGSYVVMAVALSLGLQAFVGVTPFVGWLASAVLFLFASQIHAALNRAQENELLSDALLALKQAMIAADQENENLKDQLAALKAHVDRTDKSRNMKLVSEMKVLESLVQQLASNVAREAKRVAMDDHQPDDEQVNPGWSVGGFDRSHPSSFDKASDEALLNEVRQSLQEDRVDLYLQPIVSLPQRKTRYYEALTRLRSGEGQIIMPRHYLRVAERAGLMTTIDNLLLFRCVKVLRRLLETSRDIGVFCNISVHTLQDDEFFPQFLEFMENQTDLSGRLIFEFGQETIDMCGPMELANLRRLSGLGFKFSIDRVTTLALDPNFLRDRGFRFAKVPAEVLLDDVRHEGPSDRVAALKDALNRVGLDLIAEKIEDVKVMNQIVSLGVDFGQGYLFGEPRPLRGDGIKPGAVVPKVTASRAA